MAMPVDTLNTSGSKTASQAGGFYVGVDIGGTKVAAGVVSQQGEVRRVSKELMSVNGSAEAGLKSVLSVIEYTISGESDPRLLQGIGICCPGPLDPNTGVVLNPPNLPCWRNFPLAEQVSRVFGVPVKLDNDANAAGFAETIWGAGRGYNNVFFTILGTGVGSGIVIDGRIYHGRTGLAAEGGHVTIDYKGPRCGCGKLGCAEALVAGPAIARRARAKLADTANHKSVIFELAKGDLDQVTSELVGQAYRVGDPVAKEILLEISELIAVWLGNMIDLLEPEVIIMGGGVSGMLRPLFGEIKDRLPRWSVNPRCQEIPIVSAAYGNEAGIAGGAAIMFGALV